MIRRLSRFVPGPRRGDVRRAQLLDALRGLLDERPLAEIGIADVTGALGVSRSAFYFYFPTKAAAVAALLEDVQADFEQAGAAWYEGGPGTPRERVRATVDASVALWREHARLLVAMLDGVHADPGTRAAWDAWADGFTERICGRIVADDAGGDADPRALAVLLMGATLRAMEHDVRRIAAGDGPADAVPGALIELWYRTLYA